ncbi:MAG: NAD-dependent epimerase/dehydratase family protein [bacterium]|nr:NAD-dependent epimerase/dehydratase family protein [bacterium]
MDHSSFWFGKRVLVTGGDGFVASHLISALQRLGAVVVITVRHQRPVRTLDLVRTTADIQLLPPDIEQCDLLDFDVLRRVCDRHQVDTVFHLAASAIVSDAANSPVSTIENNVMGTLNVLDVARINKIPRVLVVSSDKSYGDHAGDPREGLPYREDYALRGLDVYSASKVCADMLAQTYAYQFKVPVLVARACNIYGPGDLNFSRLIPKTIMCLLAGQPPIINLGNERVLREFMYVTDTVAAYLLLMERIADYYGPENAHMPVAGRETYGWAAFSVGNYLAEELRDFTRCGSIRSVVSIIDLLRRRVRDIAPVTRAKPANFIEIPDQFLDSKKIRALGFHPRVSFEEGIERSIAWYRSNEAYLRPFAFRYMAGKDLATAPVQATITAR